MLLLLVVSACTVLLTTYAAGYYVCAGLFLARSRQQAARRPLGALGARPQDAVTVLVPARHEGMGAVRVVRSLLQQDHEGPLEIWLLVKDSSDNALPFLQQAFADELVSGHRLRVCLTGHDPKHLKVNAAAAELVTPYVALLDGDHEAHPDWIRTSVAQLQQQGGRIVQARREPMATGSLFGLWDSLHQHVGCEVANAAYSDLGLTVFFTGTTAVMDSELLRTHPLRDCLTEDTDLSYDLALAGERILYNPHSGSTEEVSPDLYSFLARRRRWAHGHTEAFFRHLVKLGSSPIGALGRVQFLFHGVHYLVALGVFAVHGLIGLHLAQHLTLGGSLAALLAGLLVSYGLVRSQLSSLPVLLVLLSWLTPAVVLVMNVSMAVTLGDPGWIAVPLPDLLMVGGVVGLLAPLSVLIVGLRGQGKLRPAMALAVLASYPVALYLDISGVLIGLVDLLVGRRIWLAIARSGPAPRVPHTALITMRSIIMKPSRWAPPLLVAAVIAAGVASMLPARELPVTALSCKVLEHDGHPWIVPPDKLASYCGGSGHRTGSFGAPQQLGLSPLDLSVWNQLDTTFFCNQAIFRPANVLQHEQGLELELRPEVVGDRQYTAGSIATQSDDWLYGRYEVELKPPKISGVLTAFFLYRFDPWQEIDLEFVGTDTERVLVNVFYNPGEPGDLYNYGYRGTPVLVDLGFDASLDFHTYAIEWDPQEIRWFADGELIHARPLGSPTPVPHLPMRFHVNSWPICSEELAGPLDLASLPARASLRRVSLSPWAAPWGWQAPDPARWREQAGWMGQ